MGELGREGLAVLDVDSIKLYFTKDHVYLKGGLGKAWNHLLKLIQPVK